MSLTTKVIEAPLVDQNMRITQGGNFILLNGFDLKSREFNPVFFFFVSHICCVTLIRLTNVGIHHDALKIVLEACFINGVSSRHLCGVICIDKTRHV